MAFSNIFSSCIAHESLAGLGVDGHVDPGVPAERRICELDVGARQRGHTVLGELLNCGPQAQVEIKALYAQMSPGPITPEVRELTAQTISRVRGTPEEVREATLDVLEKSGGEGIILSVGGGTSPGMPRQNIIAMQQALAEFNGSRIPA